MDPIFSRYKWVAFQGVRWSGFAASVVPALVIFPVVHYQLEAFFFHLILTLYITCWFSFTTGYPSSIGCKRDSRLRRQLTCSASESKRSHWRNFETHS